MTGWSWSWVKVRVLYHPEVSYFAYISSLFQCLLTYIGVFYFSTLKMVCYSVLALGFVLCITTYDLFICYRFLSFMQYLSWARPTRFLTALVDWRWSGRASASSSTTRLWRQRRWCNHFCDDRRIKLTYSLAHLEKDSIQISSH